MKKIISVILAVSLLIGMGVLFGIDAEAVSLSTKSVKLVIGETQLILLDGADSKKVEWTSGNEKIADVENGVIKGIKTGKTTVTAKYKGKKYKCNVTVSEFRIARESSSVMVGNRLQLDLVGFSGTRTWISSDESVATVSENGILRGVSKGTAKISVKFKKNKTIHTLSFNVTVKDFSFPVTASKTAYIELSSEGAYGSDVKYFPVITKYITDKSEIKNIIKYADSLEYEFIEPDEAEAIAAEGYSRNMVNTVSETLVFYNGGGKEIGRFETALIDSIRNKTENILGYFHYNQKCYRVKGTSNLMNEIYGWKTHEQLSDAAAEIFESEYGNRKYEKINSTFSYTTYAPDAETRDGIVFRADYDCWENDCESEYISIYLDPVTGEQTGYTDELANG